jgi:uncharacterized integral membrane protein
MVACPGCRTEFRLASGGSGAAEANGEGVSERVVGRGERVSHVTHSYASRQGEKPAPSERLDEDDELPSVERQGPEPRRLWLRLAAALLLLVIVAVVALMNHTSTSVELAGSWRSKFVFVQFDVPCTYEFRPDGTFVDEHVDPATGLLVRFPGRYRVSGAEVTIQWQNGGFERAHVRATGPDTIEYTIVAHSDVGQVGAKANFVRVKR